ncbi:MAG: short-chain dehydrogenase/reductase [Acidimicrobiales bacterium]|nr:short-chain dehydrogenase/reductase [Acidimicrobiales bacterium]
MGADAFRYDGKRALVVGGATGMGNETARLLLDLGAEVVVMDHAPVDIAGVDVIKVDLRDRSSIDAALETCGGPIDALFACAGAADGTPRIERINFIGHRHLIESAVASGALRRGSAIGIISSSAGLGWEAQLHLINTLLDTPDFDAAVEWFETNESVKHYMFTKRAMSQYVARQSVGLLKQGVRINALLPGPTDTPLAQANKELWLEFGRDYRDAVGISTSKPSEQAHALVFLCSDAASYVNAATLVADAGWCSAGLSGGFPAATDAVHFLMGRFG